jgi:heme oxygenase
MHNLSDTGGQVISQKVKKNLFGLDEKDTSCHTRYGLQFCIFENIGNHDEFKALYRSRLNSIVMTKAERGK